MNVKLFFCSRVNVSCETNTRGAARRARRGAHTRTRAHARTHALSVIKCPQGKYLYSMKRHVLYRFVPVSVKASCERCDECSRLSSGRSTVDFLISPESARGSSCKAHELV